MFCDVEALGAAADWFWLGCWCFAGVFVAAPVLFALISWRRAVVALVAGVATVFVAANTAEVVWAHHAADVIEQACRETTGRASLEDNSWGVMWVECQDGVATEAYRAVDVGESLAWDFSRECFDVR